MTLVTSTNDLPLLDPNFWHDPKTCKLCQEFYGVTGLPGLPGLVGFQAFKADLLRARDNMTALEKSGDTLIREQDYAAGMRSAIAGLDIAVGSVSRVLAEAIEADARKEGVTREALVDLQRRSQEASGLHRDCKGQALDDALLAMAECLSDLLENRGL